MAIDKARELGALWLRESRSGGSYMSGKLTVNGEVIEVVAFAEREKRNPKGPDWRLYRSEPRDGQQAPPEQASAPAPAPDQRQSPRKGQYGGGFPAPEVDLEDDIPFSPCW